MPCGRRSSSSSFPSSLSGRFQVFQVRSTDCPVFSQSRRSIWLWIRTNRWMDRRFGRVRSDNPLLGGVGSLLWIYAYLGASFVDDHYAGGAGLPSAKFLVVAAGGLWYCVRRWPYSVHYLVPAAIALGFAIRFAPLRGEAAIEQWEIRAFVATLFSWTAAGLIDLALLFKVLPPRPAEKGTTADA